MDTTFLKRSWGLTILSGLFLVLWLPAVGFSAGGKPEPGGPGGVGGPPPGGGEGLGVAIQQMWGDFGTYGTLVIGPSGDVVLVNRSGEPRADGEIVDSEGKPIPLSKGTENYRIPWKDLENATDQQLEQYAEEIMKKTEIPSGEYMQAGELKRGRLTKAEIKDRLKKVREAYKTDQARSGGPPTGGLEVDVYIRQIDEAKKFEEEKARKEKEKVGLRPPVPGAPAAPTEYAAVLPRWLRGAYVSVSFGPSFTARPEWGSGGSTGCAPSP
jgi:hypothetical protein